MSEPLPASAKYVIIGAGVHGLSTAWHLAKQLPAAVASPARLQLLDESRGRTAQEAEGAVDDALGVAETARGGIGSGECVEHGGIAMLRELRGALGQHHRGGGVAVLRIAVGRQ